MSLELVYTSAAKGLSTGTGGFCTVAATAGLSRQVLGKLEALSGYQFHFNLSDANAKLNPVNYAHTRITVGAEPASVLSRIGFCGADYSGRTNKIAHHFLLEHGEQVPAGPAAMLAAPGVFLAEWNAGPQNLPKRFPWSAMAGPPPPPRPAAQWQAAAGDAGWAGLLVKAFRENPKVPAFVVFQPGQNLLPLFEESLSLLPPHERWQVGFATYYTSLPAGCQYHWRGVLEGSPAAREIARFPNAVVIDLTKSPGRAPDNEYTEAARAGRMVESPVAAGPGRARPADRTPAAAAAVAAGVAGQANGATVRPDSYEPFALDIPPVALAADAPDRCPGAVRIDDYYKYVRRARWVNPLATAAVLFMASTAILGWLYSESLSRLPAPATENSNPNSADTGKPKVNVPPRKQPAANADDIAVAAPKSANGLGTNVQPMMHELKAAADAAEAARKAAREKLDEARQHANAAEEAREMAMAASNNRNSGEAAKHANTAKAEAEAARQAATEAQESVNESKKALRQADGLGKKVLGNNGMTPEQEFEAESLTARAKAAADSLSDVPLAAKRILAEAPTAAGIAEGYAQHLAPEVRFDQKPFAHSENTNILYAKKIDETPKTFQLDKADKYVFYGFPEMLAPFIQRHDMAYRAGQCLIQIKTTDPPSLVRCMVNREGLLTYAVDSGILERMKSDPIQHFESAGLSQWAVIAVAAGDPGKLFLCVPWPEPSNKNIQVGYNAQGQPAKVEIAKTPYPWPESLVLSVPGDPPRRLLLTPSGTSPHIFMKQVTVAPLDKDEAEMKLSAGFRMTCVCKKASGPDGTIALTTEITATLNVDDLELNVRGYVPRWVHLKQRLKDIKDKESEEHKKAQGGVNRIEKRVKTLLDATTGEIESRSPIYITDASGARVMHLSISAVACKPDKLLEQLSLKK